MLDTRSPGRLSDQLIIETMDKTGRRDLTLTQADVIEDSFGIEPYPSPSVRRDVLEAQVEAHVRPLRRLGVGWDSYGALPVATQVIDTARDLLTQIVSAGLQFPALVPTVHGGLSLEWTSPGREFSITLGTEKDRAIVVSAYYFNEQSGEEWESERPSVDPRVMTALEGLRTASS